MQQRTMQVNKSSGSEQSKVKVGAFGVVHEAAAGKSVADTLAELGLTLRPEQSVRVGKSDAGIEEVRDLQARVLQPGESVVVVNRVAGG